MKWVCVCLLFMFTFRDSFCDDYEDLDVDYRFGILPSPDSHIGNGLQIGTADDTSFTLHKENLMKLKTMLEEDDVKDRELVVVSIAGTRKEGKSFLLNFFIRYLEYNENGNETNWMRKNELMNGFDWGTKRTTGISVWKKIFKRTLANGTKVAIVLIDTQGLNSIENQSFNKDARIYAFSAMASSAQCYNVFRDFNALDLGALDLFSGYGTLANEKRKHGKQFQNLNIIIRDKVEDCTDFKFGWQSEQEKNEYLGINLNDSTAKEQQSKRISKNYYERIELFYMPSPNVAGKLKYEGNLTEVDAPFIGNVTNLADSLFHPQNLVVKKVANDSMKAKYFITYLEMYSKLLNSDKLPELSTYFQKILNIKYKTWQDEGLQSYRTSMTDWIKTCDPTNNVTYLSEDELRTFHHQFKNKSLEEFWKHNTIDRDDDMYEACGRNLENNIEHEYDAAFILKNMHNKNCFKAKIKSFYGNLVKSITHTYDVLITKEVANVQNSESGFNTMREMYIHNATELFDDRNIYKDDPKYENDIAEHFRSDLEKNIINLFRNAEQKSNTIKQLKLASGATIQRNFVELLVVIAIFNAARYFT